MCIVITQWQIGQRQQTETPMQIHDVKESVVALIDHESEINCGVAWRLLKCTSVGRGCGNRLTFICPRNINSCCRIGRIIHQDSSNGEKCAWQWVNKCEGEEPSEANFYKNSNGLAEPWAQEGHPQSQNMGGLKREITIARSLLSLQNFVKLAKKDWYSKNGSL